MYPIPMHTKGKEQKYVSIILLAAFAFFTIIFACSAPLTRETKSKVIMGRDRNFIAYQDGTVLDIETGLMWANSDNGYILNWDDAKRYCVTYKGGGYDDWRMPTILELRGIFYPYRCNKDGFYISSLIKIYQGCVWASDKKGPRYAFFNFQTAWNGWNHPDVTVYCVLPVRDSKKKNHYIYAYLYKLP